MRHTLLLKPILIGIIKLIQITVQLHEEGKALFSSLGEIEICDEEKVEIFGRYDILNMFIGKLRKMQCILEIKEDFFANMNALDKRIDQFKSEVELCKLDFTPACDKHYERVQKLLSEYADIYAEFDCFEPDNSKIIYLLEKRSQVEILSRELYNMLVSFDPEASVE